MASDFKKDIGAFQKKIKQLLRDHPDDIVTIGKQLSAILATSTGNVSDKKKFLADFKDSKYHFDKVSLTDIKSVSKKEAKAKVRDVLSKIVIEKEPPADMEFPHIYIPCEYDAAGYCVGKKLAVGNQLPQLVDILTEDIFNPIKEKYLISSIFSNNVLQRLRFERHPNEEVKVIS